MEYVIRENRKGNFYPLWGTCLGFERLLQLVAQDKEAKLVEEFDAQNFAINLGFTKAAWGSGLFSKMSDDLFKEVINCSPCLLLLTNTILYVHDFLSVLQNSRNGYDMVLSML